MSVCLYTKIIKEKKNFSPCHRLSCFFFWPRHLNPFSCTHKDPSTCHPEKKFVSQLIPFRESRKKKKEKLPHFLLCFVCIVFSRTISLPWVGSDIETYFYDWLFYAFIFFLLVSHYRKRGGCGQKRKRFSGESDFLDGTESIHSIHDSKCQNISAICQNISAISSSTRMLVMEANIPLWLSYLCVMCVM